MEELKNTCLHDKHVALGAKMSPFGGFDMPIEYSGIKDEHNAVRGACGVLGQYDRLVWLPQCHAR